jgi:hypothetical protein
MKRQPTDLAESVKRRRFECALRTGTIKRTVSRSRPGIAVRLGGEPLAPDLDILDPY